MREEIDLLELIKLVWQRKLPVILAAVLAMVAAAGACFGFMEDEYAAKTSLYVLNQQNSENITSGDMSVSTNLVNDYREIILSNRVTDRVEQDLGLTSLDGYEIDVTSKNNTRIIEIIVVSHDAEMSAAVCSGLTNAFSQAVVEIMRVDNVSIIDAATIAELPSGPPRMKYVVLAAMLAAMITVGVIIATELLNTSLKSAEDVEKQTGLPVLAQFASYDKIRRGAR